MAKRFLVAVAAQFLTLGVLSGGSGVAWAADVTAGLVRVVDTAAWSPAAPGPAGVVYLSARDSLIVVDSDRNNLGEFGDDGINLWEYSLSTGTVTNTGVLPTDEPTGAGYDPATNTLFISDDNPNRVYLVRPGADGFFGTPDDPASVVINTGALGASDTEDPAFDPATGHLFVLSGTDAIVFDIDPVDGVFGNGNDSTSLFAIPGAPDDWEGLALDEGSGNLLVGARSEKQIYEITKTGALVRVIDASGIPGMRSISGLGVQPGGGGSGATYWVADRGATPIASDGMLFELAFGPAPLTPPVAQDQSVTTLMNVPVGVTLIAGDVNGDDLTYEIVDDPGSGTLTGTPPNVTYTADTGFTGPDSFTFRAHDGTEYSNTATVSITVTANQATVSVRVSQSSDDAEERSSGRVSLSSSDLEMVVDRGNIQTVGVRFTGVAVPRGATVLTASIQFQAEDASSGVTNLTIHGQATDNAPTFTGASGGISSRPRTAAAVAWAPAPWPTIGMSDPAQRSPELAAVVQEIVDRPGWSSSNALVMIISGTGERVAESYDGTPSGAPLLKIVYTLETLDPPGNVAPVVDAGVDQVAVLPGGVLLAGSVTDDGLPVPPGVVSVVWSVDSGPGVVTFGDASAANTSAAFSVDGEYVLRLTGDDGTLSGSDTTVITVEYPAGNVAPVVDAGVDQVAVLPGGVLLAGSVTDDGLPVPPGVVSVVWSVDSGPGVVTFGDASAANTSAAFSVDGEYVLRLTGDDGTLSGADTTVITVEQPAASGPSLDVRIAAAGDDVEQLASGAVSFNSSDLEMVFDRGGNQTLGLRFIGIDIPQGATVVNAWIQFKADESHSGATNLVLRAHDVGDAPVFGSGSGSLSSLPLTASSAPWSVPAWTVVGASGPAQQTPGLSTVVQEVLDRTDWARGNALAIVITGAGERVAESYNGDQAGAPLLHLEYVASGQQRPAVDAGPDQVVSPGVEVALSATVTDDGLPDPPGAVSTTWSVVTGPGTVSFDDANAQTTTATFSTPGTYVLQLDAYDGDRTGSDQVVITVTNPSGEVTLEVQVAASSDDAEEGASGGTSLRSGDLEMVQASTDQTVGLRFVGVEVPSGATITGAYIQFQADETDNVATTLLLQGQAADSAAPFASSDFNVSSRARTTASRSWSPPAWSATGEAGAAQRTDDLSGVIQEIVDRGGWSSSNAIVIIVSGTGKRVAESYDGNQAGAATLTISYIP